MDLEAKIDKLTDKVDANHSEVMGAITHVRERVSGLEASKKMMKWFVGLIISTGILGGLVAWAGRAIAGD